MIQAVLQRGLGRLDRLVSMAILLREAARTSRRWQTHAARTGFSAALIAVLLLGIHGAVTATSSSLVDSANLAWLGRGLFIGFAIAQLALATLLAPLMTATAVIEESEANTLDLLVLTRLDAGQIIAGKVVSRLLVLTTVVLGSLPITALVVNLGGVSGLEVVAVTIHTLTTVAVMGLLGAFFALFTRSPMLCVMASATYALPFFVVLPGAYALMVADPAAAAHFSPFAGAMATDPSALLPPLSYLPSLAVVWGLLLPLFQLKSARASLQHAFSHEVWQTRRWLVALGGVLLASVTLAGVVPLLYVDAAGSTLPWPLVFAGRAWVWALSSVVFAVATWAYLRIAFDVVDGLDGIFHPRRKEGEDAGPIDVGTNPVWWREARLRAWMRTAAPLVSTWILVLVGVFQTGWWMIPGGILAVAVGNAAVVLLLAAWMGCRAVAEERRRRTLEVLLTTTMSNHRIVIGKTAGVCFATAPLLVATLPLLVLGVPHLKLFTALGGGESHMLLSTFHAALTWVWLVAVWATVVAGSLVTGARVRNPRSAFGLVLVTATVFLLVPASMGRLFPDTTWLALPAQWWAPPLAGGASTLAHLGSTALWGVAAVVLYAGLTVRLRAWVLRGLVMLLALGLGASSAVAQPDLKAEMERLNQLRMAAIPVADGLHRTDGWATVSVVLENTGPATRGTLTLQEGTTDGQRRWARAVELPEGSRKELSFVFRATAYGRDRTLTFLSPEGRTAVTSFRMQPVDEDAVLIGVIGRDALGLPAAVRQTTGTVVPGHRPRPQVADRAVRTGLLLPEHLPTTSVALSGLDWIVWPSADPSTLEGPQVAALASWVADGGNLLLTVTDTHRQVSDSPLGAVLPAELGAPTLQPLGQLTQVMGAVDTGLTPTMVTPLTPVEEASVLALAPDGRPTWAVRAYGLGSVHLVAADLRTDPLDDVDRETLWRTLLFLPAVGGQLGAPEALRLAMNAYEPVPWVVRGYDQGQPYLDWEQGLRGRLDDIPGVSPLPLSWLVVFSGIYLLVIGPLDYLVLRGLRRQPLTWVTFPVAIAVFTGLAILGTRYTKGSTAILTRVELVDVLPDAQRWRGETFFGVFSTRKVDLSITSGFDDAVIAPLVDPGYLPDPTVRAGHGPGSLAYRAETWTLAYGRSSWTTEGRGQIVATRTADGLQLRNDLGVDLVGASVLLPGGGTVEVGPLAQGAEALVRFDEGDPVPTHFETDQAFALGALGAPPLTDRGDLSVAGGTAVFVGWAESTVEALHLTGLSPVEDPLLVLRQPVPGPTSHVPVRDRRLQLTLQDLSDAQRVSVTCNGGPDYQPTRHAEVKDRVATVVMPGAPRAPCEVLVETGDNTWFGTIQQTDGQLVCHVEDYQLTCEDLP